MSWHNEKWNPSLNWETHLGRLLRHSVQVLAGVITLTPFEIIIFGSSPLHMGVTISLSSRDVDLATDYEMSQIIEEAKLGKKIAFPTLRFAR